MPTEPPAPPSDPESAARRGVSSREVVFLLTGVIVGGGLTALVVLAFHVLAKSDLVRDPPVPPHGAEVIAQGPPPATIEEVTVRTIPSARRTAAVRLGVRVAVRDDHLVVLAGGERVGKRGDDCDAVLTALRKRIASFALTARTAGVQSPSLVLQSGPTVPNDLFARVVDTCMNGGIADITFVDAEVPGDD